MTIRTVQSLFSRFGLSGAGTASAKHCLTRTPSQVFFDWNTARHVLGNEAQPQKRAFTKRELQDFSRACRRAGISRCSFGQEGLAARLPRRSDVKIAYWHGLRFNELTHLQTLDFARIPPAKEFGSSARPICDTAKRRRGSPPKRRSVLTVFEWTPEVLIDWVENEQHYMDDGIDLLPANAATSFQRPH